MMLPKLGILAGGGELPEIILQACRNQGREVFVVAFEEQAPSDAFQDVPHARVRLGAAGKALKHLRQAGVKELVLAGSIRRPSLAALCPDVRAAKFFAKSGAAMLGDNGLLVALIRMLETEEGFRVVGADELVPELLASEGVYGAIEPNATDWADIELGMAAARKLGTEDIGQGAVARHGTVTSLEDAAGTDALLDRSAAGRQDQRAGVLVKASKPNQERRADLPTIGTLTVQLASNAGLAGIAIEAGGALIINRDEVVRAANAAGLFIAGVSVDQGQGN